AQIPIAELAAPPDGAYLRRFRALALFGRRPPERGVRSSFPASENLHKTGLMHCIKKHPHSITSSASCWRCGATLRPSALAVLRLIASPYLVGACTGKLAGFSPLRMRST